MRAHDEDHEHAKSGPMKNTTNVNHVCGSALQIWSTYMVEEEQLRENKT